MDLKKIVSFIMILSLMITGGFIVLENPVSGRSLEKKLSGDQWYKSPQTETTVYGLTTDLIGKKYKAGGTTPAGFDTSGFTQYVYKNAAKINLPRRAVDQYKMGTPVKKKSDLLCGDLLFFKIDGKIQSVGIYLYGWQIYGKDFGTFVTVTTKKGVSDEDIEADYWKKHYVGARRLIHPSAEAQKFYKSVYALAKKGKVIGCEFDLGTMKEEIIEKWGQPQEHYDGNPKYTIPEYMIYTDKKAGDSVEFALNAQGRVCHISVLRKGSWVNFDEIKKVLGPAQHDSAGRSGAMIDYEIDKKSFRISHGYEDGESLNGTMFEVSRLFRE